MSKMGRLRNQGASPQPRGVSVTWRPEIKTTPTLKNPSNEIYLQKVRKTPKNDVIMQEEFQFSTYN